MKTFFTSITTFYRNRHDPECAHAFAERVWTIMLAVAGIIIAGAFSYGGWILYVVWFEDGTSDVSVPSTETLNREDLRAALDTYETRVAEYEQLRATRPNIVDPAL